MPVRFRSRHAVRSGLVGLLLLPGAAMAADMPDLGFAPPPMVQEFGSNWYLRGDIGYTWQSAGMSGVGELLNFFDDTPEDEFYPAAISGGSFDDTWVIGGGFGVRASEWLRFDATIDYRAKASGTADGYFSYYFDDTIDPPVWLTPGWAGGTVKADVSSTLLLANAYVDLGTWSGFTPYVGAGVGAGYVDLGGLDIADVGRANFGGAWGFAWAVMAGASFEVGPGWLIDVGYRYSSIAGTNFSSTVSGITGINPMGTVNVNVDQIDTQEVRVGMRYMID